MPYETTEQTNQLEHSLSFDFIKEGQWSVTTDSKYEAANGMYGGWTAALLLKAAIADERTSGNASALTVNYISKIPSARTMQILTTPLGGGKTVSHWQVELINPETEKRHASATVLFASRHQSSGFLETQMPEHHNTMSTDRFSPPGAFGNEMEIIPISGFPPLNQPNTRSTSWIREKSGREVDLVQLAFLADMYPPRIWFEKKQYCPMATITLSAYFYAHSEEMSSAKTDHILMDAIGTRGKDSAYGARANLWSRDGALLATTEQLAWFTD